MWKKFDHQNITAFLGVDTGPFDLALVYDWAENGDIMQYTEKHRDASRPPLVLIIFLNDVSYLTLFLGDSCWRLRGVYNTSIRVALLTEI